MAGSGMQVWHLLDPRLEARAPVGFGAQPHTAIEACFFPFTWSDVVVVIGGDEHSLTLARMAVELGIPVVPLAGTGGAASDVPSLVPDLPKDVLDALQSGGATMIDAAMYLIRGANDAMGSEPA
ncbi:MAG: hypothetical protein KDA21_11945, partial [Phycisphaerales bacterium]|nr:hypothetical protein [Phycisphaerales bacterium]